MTSSTDPACWRCSAASGRVMLIDDVLATGGTMTAAADLCERAGYELRALAVLIDLNIVRNYSWRTLRLRAVLEY